MRISTTFQDQKGLGQLGLDNKIYATLTYFHWLELMYYDFSMMVEF